MAEVEIHQGGGFIQVEADGSVRIAPGIGTTFSGPMRDNGGQVFNVRAAPYFAKGNFNGSTGADDTFAIQWALNDAGAVNGTCYIPPPNLGCYYGVSPQANGNCLTWESDSTTLQGPGRYTPALCCISTNYSGAIIGMGTTTNTVRVGNTIRDLYIIGSGNNAYGSGSGMGFNLNATLLHMYNCRSQYLNGTNVSVQGVGAGTSVDNVLWDVYVWRLGSDTAIGFDLGSGGNGILNSELYQCHVQGLARNSGDNTTAGGNVGININAGCGQIKLVNCHPYRVKSIGLQAFNMQDLIIIGGEYENNGAAAGSNRSGMYINNINRFVIQGALGYGNYSQMINMNQSHNGSISGVWDWGGSANQSQNMFLGSSTLVVVANCPYLGGNSGTVSINTGSCDYMTYIGNDANHGRIVTSGIHDRQIGNFGTFGNPKGLLSTNPAVPVIALTTVAVNNNTGFDCTVNIIGGTVTAIAVAGTTLTGITTGLVRVCAGQTITLTYSAAPTWQWLGD